MASPFNAAPSFSHQTFLTEYAFLTFYVLPILLFLADGLPRHSLCVRIRPVPELEGKKYNFALNLTR